MNNRPQGSVWAKPCPMPTTTTLNSIVVVQDGQPVTDSRRVAVEFDRHHKNVLRAIDAMHSDLSPEFWRLNFEPATYADERGQARRMYRMTEAGFTALVMGFTGRKSIQLRERFITAFQRVTAELQRQRATSGWSAVAQLASLDAERQQIEARASDAARTLGKLRSLRRLNDLESAPLRALVQRDLFALDLEGGVA